MVAGLNGTDLVQVIKFSLEGVAYTPIAIVGLFGKCWHGIVWSRVLGYKSEIYLHLCKLIFQTGCQGSTR